MDVKKLTSMLKAYPDFPSKGILFQDVFPIFQDPIAVETLITHFVHHLNSFHDKKIDVIVGLDARGFMLGPMIAGRLGAAFVPVRKPGKLPGRCVSASYVKEYGTDVFEMQADAIKPGQNVVIVDDLIATGGSAVAATELVTKLNAKVVKYLFIVELIELKGTRNLEAPAYSIIRK